MPPASPTGSKPRYKEIDVARGLALVMMILFHFSFDLNYFGYIDIDIYRGMEWKVFRVVIVSLFLLCVGISLVLVHEHGIRWNSVKKRAVVLGASALAITLVTMVVFPRGWIYFGILHFIFTASLAALPFIGRPWLALVTGVGIIVLYRLDLIGFHWLFLLLDTWLPSRTEDIARFFPWFGVVLIGVFIGHRRLFRMALPEIKPVSGLAFLGRHSLTVYLIHQPILFGILLLVHQVR